MKVVGSPFTQRVMRERFCALLSFLLLCGCTSDDPPNGVPDTGASPLLEETEGFYSPPLTFAVAGDDYRYVPRFVGADADKLALGSHPDGLELKDGALEWKPSVAQAGEHSVEVLLGGTKHVQRFSIRVATTKARISEDVVPERDAWITVPQPLSPIYGAALRVPAGALQSPETITLSDLSVGPSILGGLGPFVHLGPAGLRFDEPALLRLPLSAAAAGLSDALTAFIYDVETGNWEEATVVEANADGADPYLVAEVRHFSAAVAARRPAELGLVMRRMGEDTQCAGRVGVAVDLGGLLDLDARARLDLPDVVPENVATLRDLADWALATAPHYLEASYAFELAMVFQWRVNPDGPVMESDPVAMRIWQRAHGWNYAPEITYHGAQTSFSVTDPETFEAHLSGAPWAYFLPELEQPLGDDALVGVRLHAYLTEQRVLEIPELVGLATATAPLAPLANVAVGGDDWDRDCDGISNEFDESPDVISGDLIASPLGRIMVDPGDRVRLRATLRDPGLERQDWHVSGIPQGSEPTWRLDDRDFNHDCGRPQCRMQARSVELTFRPLHPGDHIIQFTAGYQNRKRHQFRVQVSDRPVPLPRCSGGTAVTSILVSEQIDLEARRWGEADYLAAHGAEALARLSVEWGRVAGEGPRTLEPLRGLTGAGSRAAFLASELGEFRLGCRYTDGEQLGPVSPGLTVAVLPEHQNRNPEMYISPRFPRGELGELVTVTAVAQDLDGDALAFTWSREDLIEARHDEALRSEVQYRFPLDLRGSLRLEVHVDDERGARETVNFSITPRPPIRPPRWDDEDGDGFRAGIDAEYEEEEGNIDCDDSDPNINPAAREVCGNDVDENCDGVATTIEDCDADGDRYTLANGDCDDDNRFVHPKAREEWCDGVDDDCDGEIDNGFGRDGAVVGGACQIGSGVCAADGELGCSMQHYLVCRGQPLEPEEEVCDLLDNDCDGLIDEIGCAEDCASGGNALCGEHAYCEDVRPSGFECTCARGYFGNGRECEDIDECQAGMHVCSEHASCENAAGYYRCVCDVGFAGSGVTCLQDSDGDGVADADDRCPNNPDKQILDACGCSMVDADADGDGLCGEEDNCPAIANVDQTDSDGDGQGDACDACPGDTCFWGTDLSVVSAEGELASLADKTLLLGAALVVSDDAFGHFASCDDAGGFHNAHLNFSESVVYAGAELTQEQRTAVDLLAGLLGTASFTPIMVNGWYDGINEWFTVTASGGSTTDFGPEPDESARQLWVEVSGGNPEGPRCVLDEGAETLTFGGTLSLEVTTALGEPRGKLVLLGQYGYRPPALPPPEVF